MQERITTPFNADSTAMDVINGLDLSGRRAVVTGGSSGIGVETARALAGAGAEVTLTSRSAEDAAKVAAAIRQSSGSDKVQGAPLDLADEASIDAFAQSWQGPLHILVNNAGMMGFPTLQLQANGYEAQFAVNHLGHFRLTVGLHSALKAAGNARIASLSSRGHLRSPVVFEDINFTSRPYDPMLAYGQSKTANILFAVGVMEQWAADGITANAVHPGTIASTNLSRYMDLELVKAIISAPYFRDKTIEQGAATSVLVAASPQLEGIGGRYFEDCNEAQVVHPEPGGGTLASGVAEYALDRENAKRLWELSLSVLQLSASKL